MDVSDALTLQSSGFEGGKRNHFFDFDMLYTYRSPIIYNLASSE